MEKILEILNSPISHIIIGFSVIISLIIPVKNAWISLRRAKQSKFWKTTNGRILESNIHSYKNDEGQKMFELNFKYNYSINDITYLSKGRYLDDEISQSWIGKLQGFVDSNRPNEEITVFYDPNNPKISVIKNDIRPRYYLIPAMYLLFVVIGFTFVIIGMYNL